MLAFVNFIQPYLLNANLQVPQGSQGRVLGLLGFSNELIAILLVAPFMVFGCWLLMRPRGPQA